MHDQLFMEDTNCNTLLGMIENGFFWMVTSSDFIHLSQLDARSSYVPS